MAVTMKKMAGKTASSKKRAYYDRTVVEPAGRLIAALAKKAKKRSIPGR
jgi:hypothetical protein